MHRIYYLTHSIPIIIKHEGSLENSYCWEALSMWILFSIQKSLKNKRPWHNDEKSDSTLRCVLIHEMNQEFSSLADLTLACRPSPVERHAAVCISTSSRSATTAILSQTSSTIFNLASLQWMISSGPSERWAFWLFSNRASFCREILGPRHAFCVASRLHSKVSPDTDTEQNDRPRWEPSRHSTLGSTARVWWSLPRPRPDYSETTSHLPSRKFRCF